MTRVIERCPSCGVEHEVRADECEACGSALRWWCRAHSREIGWLETAECHRCTQAVARPRRGAKPAHARGKPPGRAEAYVPAQVREVRLKVVLQWMFGTGGVGVLLLSALFVYPVLQAGGDVGLAVIDVIFGGGMLGFALGLCIGVVRALYKHD